ncbi:MAG: hypothetical protein K2G40_07155, partial [Muribaculaceae bacterium]|nr:hypothetical protein [Muribaculaceae bacterium]
NYIWAYTCGDTNYRNSEPKLIKVTEIVDSDKLHMLSFRLIPDGETLTEGEHVIITFHTDNEIHALGYSVDDMSHTAIYFPGKQFNYFSTSREELKYYGILEFTVQNGHLMEIESDNYLSPGNNSATNLNRSLLDDAPYQTDFTSTELYHTLNINDLYLIGDKDGFRFSDQPGYISVYTTRDDFTDVIENTVDNNLDIEYYNLQGQKVANPSSGFYIEKKGNITRKILIK